MKSVKSKIVCIVLFLFVFYGICAYGIQHYIVLKKFLNLEQEAAAKDIERVIQAIKRETYHLDSFCHDWAAWDETYEFTKNSSKKYIKTNLNLTTFTVNKLNLIAFYTLDGRQLWYEAYNLSEEALISIPDFSAPALPRNHPLLAYTLDKPLPEVAVSGIYITAHGPMMVSSRPILKSSGEGPIRGILIVGRFLDDAAIKTIIEQTKISFKVYQTEGKDIPAEQKRIIDQLSPLTPFLIEQQKNDFLRCSTRLSDVSGKSVLLITAQIPRNIFLEGTQIIHYAFILRLGVGICVLLIMLFLLKNTIIKPLMQLTDHAKYVSKSGDLSAEITLSQHDEIGNLAQVFNQMVKKLSDTIGHLEESEAMYRLITENSLASIIMVQDDRIIYANKRALELTGYLPEEFNGINVWQIVHPDDLETIKKRAFTKLAGDDINDYYEFRYLTKNGHVRWLEILGVPIQYKSKKTLLAHAIDITEKKKAQIEQTRLEEKLRKANNMEMIGMLAGGVAHDLNNILSGIVTYPDLLIHELPEESPLRDPLLTIQQAGQRATTIVHDILSLSRRDIVVSDTVNLNDVIMNYLKSLEHKKLLTFHPRVVVDINLAANLHNIKGSAAHLSKTLMNLVSNAAEAMPYGGNITIITANKYIDKTLQGYESINEGNYVVVTISDTGIGISQNDLEKIFEPFYTKKVMGRSGTGLGMSVVWTTVKDHNGFINIQSIEGQGTTFTLYFLPTFEELIKEEGSIPIEQYMGRGEKILVVDDVETQRKIAEHLLKKLDYSVITVANGEAAIDYMKENSADLLIIDMIMDPGIDGLETYKRILAIHPGQKALIVSGYTETDRVRDAQKLGAGIYIMKPYTMEKIGVSIRKTLTAS